MDLTQATDIITAAAQQPPGTVRVEPGRWDGQKVFLERSPDNGLVAENAAGPLTPGQRVLCLLWSGRVAIIGPAATTLAAEVAALRAHLARLPRAQAAGTFREPDAGATVSYISFPAGRFLRPPVVTVTLMSGSGAHSWDTPRVLETTMSGFRLFTRNGAGSLWAWHAVEF